jgi:hypothetical protein
VGLESTTAPSSAECSPRLSYLGVKLAPNLGIKVSFDYGFQITSGVLVRLFAKRAMTKKRSDNRFRYFWHEMFIVSFFDNSTRIVSARLVVVRAKCKNAATVFPPGRIKFASGANSDSNLSMCDSRFSIMDSVIRVFWSDRFGLDRSEPATKSSFWICTSNDFTSESRSCVRIMPKTELISSTAPYAWIRRSDFEILMPPCRPVVPSSPVLV